MKRQKKHPVQNSAAKRMVSPRPGQTKTLAAHPPANTGADFPFSPCVQSWLLGLFLVAATVLAYQPVWHAGFIWDDDVYVTGNRLLTAPDGLWRIWFSFDSPSQYFPLVYTAFRLEHLLWGLNPAGYHWVNLLLHTANALLVWRLLWRLGVPGSWLAAAIFALHPVQVESVAWIAELKNVLMLFFFLLTLLAWVEFIDEKTGPKWKYYALALVCYAPALCAKTTACTLPAALLLILWLKEKPVTRRRLAEVTPFLALGIGMGLLTVWWERYHQGTQGTPFAMGLMDRMLVASRALWFYAGKLLWPVNLMFNYPRWTISAANPAAYAWLLATAGLGAAIWRVRRHAGRGVEVAVLFFVATLGPVLGFIMLYTFLYSFVADHYQYVACLGPVALFSAGLAKLAGCWKRRRPWLEAMVCAGLLLLLGTLTWRQCKMYADTETLWRTTLDRNPVSWMACNNLGFALVPQGRADEAIVQYQKALAIKPDYAEAHNNLGATLFQKGQTNEAIAQYQMALAIKPDFAEAHYNLGNALLQKEKVDEAIVHYQKALANEFDNAEAHNSFGSALLQKGRLDEAIIQFQKALAIKPGHAEAHDNLGNALFQKGQTDEAVAQYQMAIGIDPDFADPHDNLGSALFKIGQTDEAIAQYQMAIAIKPGFAEAHYNLGNALLPKGRVDEAAVQFQKALSIKPDYADAHYNLGNYLLQKGRVDEAILHFQEALAIQPDFIYARNNLGAALLQKGRLDEAIVQFQKALALQPGLVEAQGDLASIAWMMATSPDAAVRNGTKAVELARQTDQLSGGKNPVMAATLAAAYAEAGRFPDAIATAQHALQLANGQTNATLVATLEAQLKLYQAGSPLRKTGASH
jgi:tetratricopeptide (TPR) repeat protein